MNSGTQSYPIQLKHLIENQMFRDQVYLALTRVRMLMTQVIQHQEKQHQFQFLIKLQVNRSILMKGMTFLTRGIQ